MKYIQAILLNENKEEIGTMQEFGLKNYMEEVRIYAELYPDAKFVKIGGGACSFVKELKEI